jgi:hypothetical protein
MRVSWVAPPAMAKLAGVAGEPPGRGAGRGRQLGLVFLGGFGQHRGDLGDRDDVQVQGGGAGGLDRFGAVATAQAQQPVHGPHHGPGQRVVQQSLRVDPTVHTVTRGRGDELVQVPQRVPGLLLRQVGRLGDPSARWLAGVGLDQLALVEQLDQYLVGAGVQVLS